MQEICVGDSSARCRNRVKDLSGQTFDNLKSSASADGAKLNVAHGQSGFANVSDATDEPSRRRII